MKKLVKIALVAAFAFGAAALAPKVKIEIRDDAANACPGGVRDC